MHPLVDLFAFGARIVHAVVAHLGVHAAVGIPVWPLELLVPPLELFLRALELSVEALERQMLVKRTTSCTLSYGC